MRTKSEMVHNFSEQMNYDIFVFVETWLNENFFDGEFFNSNLFNVFRKDRDAEKTGCLRGGGVLIAIKRQLQASLVTLSNGDSLLDQLCVCVNGSTPQDSLYLLASYVPPGSSFELYKAHADNIASLVLNNVKEHHLCVLGDFNLPNINWSTSISNNYGLTPNNVNSSQELYFIDNVLSLNLIQINNYFNSLNRLLDLIFISDNFCCEVSECLNPVTSKDRHHLPLVVEFRFYHFPPVTTVSRPIFNYSSCDFVSLNDILLEINWEELLGGLDTSVSFSAFKSIVYTQCLDRIPLRVKRAYKLPWYTKELNKLKNLKNKFLKKFHKSKNNFFFSKYKLYLKDFNILNKSLYSEYMRKIEGNIKSNPKSFWKYLKDKKSSASVPTGVFLDDYSAKTPDEAANLFADFFKSNFSVDDSSLPLDLSNSLNSALNFGSC
ncbi:PREDICTED: uncharacterized protein LOC108368584 [Rhagoletis zephyria]|uniref:uncharacterized protein LOC108368584 n=1 Tax=Rhagoletis zephyria TaxID=28612 RepID=UPI0008115AD3|nr:PREDICTED: uncharacterized protein LOC108368584 [Rhagoletis zephyria]